MSNEFRFYTFIVNREKKRIHNTFHLDERCNTDDMRKKEQIRGDQVEELISQGYMFCWWCERRYQQRAI